MLWSTRRAYEQKEPAEQFLCVTWTKVHEQVIGGKIGVPDFQADWEAFMAAVAVRTWISSRSRGRITLVGDASGVIAGMVAMRARSASVNNVIKEVALHLPPGFGLLRDSCLGRMQHGDGRPEPHQ